MNTMRLMCGACSPSTLPGLTVSKMNLLSASVPVPKRPKPRNFWFDAAQVGGMRVAAFRVRLPDFDHSVRDRLAGAVEHAAHNTDTLSAARVIAQITGCDAVKADSHIAAR